MLAKYIVTVRIRRLHHSVYFEYREYTSQTLRKKRNQTNLISKENNSRKPNGYWQDPKQLKEFLEHCSEKLNIKTPDDWYQVSKAQIGELGGRALYGVYPNLVSALTVAYPNHKWIHCLFNKSPKGAWKDPKHLKDFFEYCSEKFNINTLDDWYQVSKAQIGLLGCRSLYSAYPNLASALTVAYPDHKWIHCLFNMCPKGAWKDPKHLRDFFEYCKVQLDISNVDDWKRISSKQFSELGGKSLFENGKNAAHSLRIAYPEYPPETFDPIYFSNRAKRSSQRWLYVQLSKLLPKGTKIIEEYHHPLCYWEGRKPMQFDIWVPDYNLALEYQGEHHYQDIPGIGSSFAINKTRDNVKQNTAKALNIKFLVIPYWWDGSASSLGATLHYNFPNLFPPNETGKVIPSKPIK